MAERAANFVPGLGRIYREGERNDRLFRRGCALRRKETSQEEIENALDILNRRHCQPPLPGAEIKKIAGSAMHYPAGGPDPLEAAWRKLTGKYKSKYARFLAWILELQLSRQGFSVALPTGRMAERLQCTRVAVVQFRQKATCEGLMELIERYSHVGKRASSYKVDIERVSSALHCLGKVAAKSLKEKVEDAALSRVSNPSRVRTYSMPSSGTRVSESLSQVLRVADRGFRLFPCKAREKTPAVTNWPERATCDAVLLAQWFEKFPDCNWAVACGEGSACWVLDIDGDDGQRSWLQLRAEHDHITTLAQGTARGQHMFFSWPAEGGIRNSAGKVRPGLDVRGEGGYALVPPSIHPSGHRYQWIDADTPISPAPAWLLAVIAEPKPAASVLQQDATSFDYGWNVAEERYERSCLARIT